MSLNRRLHCPGNSLRWLWNISGQNTLWVPLVIIPYHKPPMWVVGRAPPRAGTVSLWMMAALRADCPPEWDMERARSPEGQGFGSLHLQMLETQAQGPHWRTKAKTVSHHWLWTLGSLGWLWYSVTVTARPQHLGLSERPHETTVPFTCVRSASHGTDAKARPEDTWWAEDRVDTKIQGGNISIETVCFSFILKLLNIYLLVKPLMRRKNRVHGQARLWGCLEAFRVPPVLLFERRRRLGPWRPLRPSPTSEAHTSHLSLVMTQYLVKWNWNLQWGSTSAIKMIFSLSWSTASPTICELQLKSEAGSTFAIKTGIFFKKKFCTNLDN